MKGTDTVLRRGWLVLAPLCGILLAFLMPETWIFRSPEPGPAAGEAGGGWACPMFCTVMESQPEDGLCPVCGMELGPVATETLLGPAERGMIGLEAARLEPRLLSRELRLSGEVDWDETRLASVTARAAGWVVGLEAAASWQSVSAGAVLAELDSPEIGAAAVELLVAARSGDDGLLASARRRLDLLGLSSADVDEILAGRLDPRRVPLRAPRDGVVAHRGATLGAHLRAGQEAFAVAGIDRVWIQFEVFAPDLHLLVPGTRVRFEHAGSPGRRFDGAIEFVDPVIERRSRTARVRVAVANPADEAGRRPFVPGQRIEAALLVPVGAEGGVASAGPEPVLALPRSAVLRTGRRAVVFVLYESRLERSPSGRELRVRAYDLDPERLPPRVGFELVEVEVASLARAAESERLEEYLPVRSSRSGEEGGLEALRPGLVVAVDGALLLDSQAQLAGRPSLLHPEGRAGAADDPHAGH